MTGGVFAHRSKIYLCGHEDVCVPKKGRCNNINDANANASPYDPRPHLSSPNRPQSQIKYNARVTSQLQTPFAVRGRSLCAVQLSTFWTLQPRHIIHIQSPRYTKTPKLHPLSLLVTAPQISMWTCSSICIIHIYIHIHVHTLPKLLKADPCLCSSCDNCVIIQVVLAFAVLATTAILAR